MKSQSCEKIHCSRRLNINNNNSNNNNNDKNVHISIPLWYRLYRWWVDRMNVIYCQPV